MSLTRLFNRERAEAPRVQTVAVPASQVRHRLHWNDGAVLWAAEDGIADDASLAPFPLEARRPLRFEIVPTADALATLLVKVGTYRRTNVGRLRCSLGTQTGAVLASGSTDLSQLDDNGFAAVLDLRGVTFSAGTPCWVELEVDAEPGNEIAVYRGTGDRAQTLARRTLRGFDPGAAIPADEPVRSLLPNYRLDWTARDAFWSTWPSSASEAPQPLALEPNRPFEFDIVAPTRRLDVVSVQFGTYGRRSRSHVAFELAGPSGEILHREGFDLADVPDNNFAPLAHLRDLDLEPGRKYRARLHWLGPPGEEVALYVAPVRAGRYELRPHLERLDPARIFADRSWDKAVRAAERAVLIIDPSRADGPAPVLTAVRELFPSLRCLVLGFEEALAHLDVLRSADLVVFADMYHQQARDGLTYDDLCFDLHRNRVCTVFVDVSAATAPPPGTTLSSALRTAGNFRRAHARR